MVGLGGYACNVIKLIDNNSVSIVCTVHRTVAWYHRRIDRKSNMLSVTVSQLFNSDLPSKRECGESPDVPIVSCCYT